MSLEYIGENHGTCEETGKQHGRIPRYEGEGRGNDRRQQEEQAAREAHSKELAKARYEKRKQDKREFTARKKAGLLTPEEQETKEKRLAHNREWQKEWREKRRATEPEKPPKKKSIKEIMAIEKTGADLTPEETERLAAYRRKKADQQKAGRERKKVGQPVIHITHNADYYGIHPFPYTYLYKQ